MQQSANCHESQLESEITVARITFLRGFDTFRLPVYHSFQRPFKLLPPLPLTYNQMQCKRQIRLSKLAHYCLLLLFPVAHENNNKNVTTPNIQRTHVVRNRDRSAGCGVRLLAEPFPSAGKALLGWPTLARLD